MRKQPPIELLLRWKTELAWKTARGVRDDWDLTGIIAANLTQPELNELAPLQIQIVNIVSSRPTVASLPRLCHIQMDFYKAGQMAAEYLCNLGFEQITTVSVHTEQMGTDTHSAGFRDVLAARGLLAEPLYVSENYPSIPPV